MDLGGLARAAHRPGKCRQAAEAAGRTRTGHTVCGTGPLHSFRSNASGLNTAFWLPRMLVARFYRVAKSLPRSPFRYQTRPITNFSGNRPRYVRFGEQGGSGNSSSGRPNPWDPRGWDRNMRIIAGIGTFGVGYYVSQYVCRSPISLAKARGLISAAGIFNQFRDSSGDGEMEVYGYLAQIRG